MAIDNFVPELWDAAIQVPYEKALVFGQPTVANRDYEGEIRQQGDTVHVTTIDDVTVNDYDKTTDLQVEDLDDATTDLVINQGKYFAFGVNDIDEVQAAGNFRSPALENAGYKLKDASDQFIASLFVENVATGGPIADNRLAGFTVPELDADKIASGDGIPAYQVLVKLRQLLDNQSVPLEGRYVVVNPEFVSCLLLDKRYTDLSSSGSSEGLRNGQVGRASGFDVLVSNNLPSQGGTFTLCAGVPGALSYADQIVKTEALRDPKRFRDIVRGLNVYGAKIFRRNGVATATVTIDSPFEDEES